VASRSLSSSTSIRIASDIFDRFTPFGIFIFKAFKSLIRAMISRFVGMSFCSSSYGSKICGSSNAKWYCDLTAASRSCSPWNRLHQPEGHELASLSSGLSLNKASSYSAPIPSPESSSGISRFVPHRLLPQPSPSPAHTPERSSSPHSTQAAAAAPPHRGCKPPAGQRRCCHLGSAGDGGSARGC
jgi:hypothetical protein